MSDQTRKALEVKRKHEDTWMNIEGVVAVGLGMVDEEIGIIVSVKKDAGDIRGKIPSVVDGVPVVIQHSGEISAL